MGENPGDRRTAKLRMLEGRAAPLAPLASSLAGPGEPPDHLDREAAEVWNTLVARTAPGQLQPADATALEQLAVHTVLWRRAVAMVKRRGLLQRDTDRRGGPQRIAAWVKLAALEQRAVLDLSRALGLTPLSRSSVRVPPPQATERSELEMLLDVPVPGDYPRPS